MLRQSRPRLLVAFTCFALCLTLGALPAAALPGLESAPAISFDAGSWFARFWQWVEEPVVSLFAPDGAPAPVPVPTPPTSNAGVTIDPDGAPRP
ncbi:MAG TPA: hypothetical protein VN851_27770 [Thermoanaerobaculia bacterium]|nr:hypothetical protein [Thermoanaerobaculia bacterium]